MLWDVSKLIGYTIEAFDGRLGSVTDALFDEGRWKLRWGVVETGNWLAGRRVLLPFTALGKPCASLEIVPVRLSMREVQGSPEEGAHLPVSRQMEGRGLTYYAMPLNWNAPMIGSNTSDGSTPSVAADLPSNGGDTSLRSTQSVTGYHIHATDGGLGHVEDFLVDDTDWRLRYLKVDTKNWWPGEKVLISPLSVDRIDWADRQIHLNINRQRVKDSPRYDPMQAVDGAYDEQFLTYYGIRWV